MGQVNIWTAKPDGTDVRYLAEYGSLSDIEYSDTIPGGPDQLTCSLGMDPARRPQALDVGRRVVAVAGASVQWEGILLEAVPNEGGFDISSDGAGTWGSRYRDFWADLNHVDVINRAITERGLRWIQGDLSTSFLDQVADPGSHTITEYLNTVTSPANLTWRLTRAVAPQGWELNIVTLPDAAASPTRILMTSVSAIRTIAGYVNYLYVKYTTTADSSGNPATYTVVGVANSDSIAKHDRLEAYWDLSDAGVLAEATVISYAQQAMAKYQAASYGGPFTVTYGQYLNAGGAPVDLACEKAGEVVRVVFEDGPYGGQVSPAPPVQFVAGKVSYKDADRSAEITPFQVWQSDWSELLDQIKPKAPA